MAWNETGQSRMRQDKWMEWKELGRTALHKISVSPLLPLLCCHSSLVGAVKTGETQISFSIISAELQGPLIQLPHGHWKPRDHWMRESQGATGVLSSIFCSHLHHTLPSWDNSCGFGHERHPVGKTRAKTKSPQWGHFQVLCGGQKTAPPKVPIS